MKIIAGKSGLAATPFDACAKIALIRTLVFGKPDITVDAEHTIPGAKTRNGRIQLLQFINEQLNEIGKIDPGGFILNAVLIKPVLIVVFFQTGEEFQGLRC